MYTETDTGSQGVTVCDIVTHGVTMCDIVTHGVSICDIIIYTMYVINYTMYSKSNHVHSKINYISIQYTTLYTFVYILFCERPNGGSITTLRPLSYFASKYNGL